MIKYKYRIVTNGFEEYRPQYKARGLLSILDSWTSHFSYYKTLDEARDWIKQQINDEKRKRFNKVIETYE